eukprot:3622671-Pleurochrysis_carterae.AAC.2
MSDLHCMTRKFQGFDAILSEVSMRALASWLRSALYTAERMCLHRPFNRRHGWVAPATGSLSARGELAAVDVRGRVSPHSRSSPSTPASSTNPWSAGDADDLLGRRRKALAQPHGNTESLRTDLSGLASRAAPGLRSRTLPGPVPTLSKNEIA